MQDIRVDDILYLWVPKKKKSVGFVQTVCDPSGNLLLTLPWRLRFALLFPHLWEDAVCTIEWSFDVSNIIFCLAYCLCLISECPVIFLCRPHIKTIFQSIAAKVGTGEPCCDWVNEADKVANGNLGVHLAAFGFLPCHATFQPFWNYIFHFLFHEAHGRIHPHNSLV